MKTAAALFGGLLGWAIGLALEAAAVYVVWLFVMGVLHGLGW